ncbi:MAG: glycosyltransferase family 4 protein [Chthoniobacterales bacterium]|nr:glycosyltransferase family 4 protein [Chthoniobacterales bacterium]
MAVFSIAMVAACPFPANHGTPAAIKEMAEELARRGHSIRVVTYPLSHDIPVTGVEIDRVAQIGWNRAVNVGPSYQRLMFDALLLLKLFQVVRSSKIEVIHAHNYEAALIGGIVGRLTGVPVIYNAINTMISELPSFGFIRPRAFAIGLARVLDYIVPRMADSIIADTEELRSFILGKGIDPERVITIHSGVRPEMFEAADGARVRNRFADSDAPLIIYTGTFDAFQGLSYLLEAFKIVHEHKPTARLLLVGSTINPAHLAKYEKMAEQLGFASQVQFTSCTLEELPDFLAASDVAVVPRPESPGIPTKLLNYMAAGNAIVSFKRSATVLEHGKTAFLVEPATAENLARGIMTLLDDLALASKLRKNVRNFVVGRFDWPSIARKLETVYESLTPDSISDSLGQTGVPPVMPRRRRSRAEL